MNGKTCPQREENSVHRILKRRFRSVHYQSQLGKRMWVSVANDLQRQWCVTTLGHSCWRFIKYWVSKRKRRAYQKNVLDWGHCNKAEFLMNEPGAIKEAPWDDFPYRTVKSQSGGTALIAYPLNKKPTSSSRSVSVKNIFSFTKIPNW